MRLLSATIAGSFHFVILPENIPATVQTIEYDPNRTARMAFRRQAQGLDHQRPAQLPAACRFGGDHAADRGFPVFHTRRQQPGIGEQLTGGVRAAEMAAGWIEAVHVREHALLLDDEDLSDLVLPEGMEDEIDAWLDGDRDV